MVAWQWIVNHAMPDLNFMTLKHIKARYTERPLRRQVLHLWIPSDSYRDLNALRHR